MSEIDDDLLTPDEGDSNAMKAVRQALRAAKKQTTEMAAQLEALKAQADRAVALERESTFLKAGVPVDDKWGSMFAKAYDGEVTIEAVKAAWAELAPAKPSAAAPEQPSIDYMSEAAAADRMSAAAPTGFDPAREAAFEAESAAATTPQQLIAVLGKYGKLAVPQD
jgi:hypothetical protein